MFIDCHSHLDQYDSTELVSILDRATTANVTHIVCAGTSLDSSEKCIRLTQKSNILFSGVGIHPMEVNTRFDDNTYKSLARLATSNEKVVCISEIGLDYQPTSPAKDLQVEAFRSQIRLAIELHLPIIFHSRNAHAETLKVLREEKASAVKGAFHYFQGSEQTAYEAIDEGFFISLAKPLLWLDELQTVARNLPLEHIVLETDSFPQPWKKHRRNWTEPHHIITIAEKLAEIKHSTVDEVAFITSNNAKKLLHL